MIVATLETVETRYGTTIVRTIRSHRDARHVLAQDGVSLIDSNQ
jgi:hypothetical protein